MAAYTDEQIQKVCSAAAEVMAPFTVAHNCTFPSTAIIAGMKAGKTPEKIGDDAYNTVVDLPLYQTGFGLVGMGDSMHNIASYMRAEVINQIKALG